MSSDNFSEKRPFSGPNTIDNNLDMNLHNDSLVKETEKVELTSFVKDTETMEPSSLVKGKNQCQGQTWECCDKVFSNKSNFRRHMRTVHANEKSNCNTTLLEKTETSNFICTFCEKKFSKKSNLMRHLRLIHKLQEQSGSGCVPSFYCLEEDCSTRVNSAVDLRKHLISIHGKELKEKSLQFENMSDFLSWKSTYEQEMLVNFVKETGSKRLRNGDIRHHYVCHRSGKIRKKENPSRYFSTYKTGFKCTASIVATEKINKTVICSVFEDHYGHKKQIGFLKLSENEKHMIASKLANNVEINDILKEIRDSFILKTFPSRIDITNRQDIKNIQKKFHLYEGRKHDDDATSVEIMLNELKMDRENNPILGYKFQGDDGTDFLSELNKEDIFIAIQHPVQQEMLKTFGHKCVCVDSTHGTNKYGFNLITLLVIDEYDEGFPVAFCVSSKEDKITLKAFFGLIKEKLPENFHAEFFMSDDAKAYYNAWFDVFGISKKILCSWHVQKALRGKLQTLVKDKFLMCQIFKLLIIILEERDIDKFDFLVQSLNEVLDVEGAQDFAKYFRSTYSHRWPEIAACFRLQSCINTNMHVESFHRILKYNFLDGKVNHRLDTCIFQLLEYIKYQSHERILKLERGKRTNKVRMINNRHKTSLELSYDLIIASDNFNYTVRSSKTPEKDYVVEIEKEKRCTCKIFCNQCEICIHQVNCTCMDFLIRHVICKHVHLVARKIKESCMQVTTARNNNDKEAETSLCGTPKILEFIKHQPSDVATAFSLIEKVSQQIKELDSRNESKPIQKANKMLEDVSNFLTAQLSASETKKLPEATEKNINITKQRSIYNVKKTYKAKKSILIKPSEKEKEKLLQEIKNPLVENVIGPAEDHVYAKNNITSKYSITEGRKLQVLTKHQENVLKQILKTKMTTIFKDRIITPEDILPDEEIDDSIIDMDIQNIEHLMSDEAYKKLCTMIEVKKTLWQCSSCTVLTTKKNMICCDKCLKWYHFDCCNVVNAAEEKDWFCESCT